MYIKRKTMKRKTKHKNVKRKTMKRKTKHKNVKRKTMKRKTMKRKTVKKTNKYFKRFKKIKYGGGFGKTITLSGGIEVPLATKNIPSVLVDLDPKDLNLYINNILPIANTFVMYLTTHKSVDIYGVFFENPNMNNKWFRSLMRYSDFDTLKQVIEGIAKRGANSQEITFYKNIFANGFGKKSEFWPKKYEKDTGTRANKFTAFLRRMMYDVGSNDGDPEISTSIKNNIFLFMSGQAEKHPIKAIQLSDLTDMKLLPGAINTHDNIYAYNFLTAKKMMEFSNVGNVNEKMKKQLAYRAVEYVRLDLGVEIKLGEGGQGSVYVDKVDRTKAIKHINLELNLEPRKKDELITESYNEYHIMKKVKQIRDNNPEYSDVNVFQFHELLDCSSPDNRDLQPKCDKNSDDYLEFTMDRVGKSKMEAKDLLDYYDELSITSERLNTIINSDHLNILYGIFKAIRMLNENGIAHRDIKPENVMIDLSEGNIKVVVVDYGFAVELTDNLEFKSGINTAGTQEYYPLVYLGRVTERFPHDLYSFAIIMVDVLAFIYNIIQEKIYHNKIDVNKLTTVLLEIDRNPKHNCNLDLTSEQEQIIKVLIDIIISILDFYRNISGKKHEQNIPFNKQLLDIYISIDDKFQRLIS